MHHPNSIWSIWYTTPRIITQIINWSADTS